MSIMGDISISISSSTGALVLLSLEAIRVGPWESGLGVGSREARKDREGVPPGHKSTRAGSASVSGLALETFRDFGQLLFGVHRGDAGVEHVDFCVVAVGDKLVQAVLEEEVAEQGWESDAETTSRGE